MTIPRDGGQYSTMSLRDYFAAQALRGIFSDHDTISKLFDASEQDENKTRSNAASEAYKLADAMLAERARAEGQ